MATHGCVIKTRTLHKHPPNSLFHREFCRINNRSVLSQTHAGTLSCNAIGIQKSILCRITAGASALAMYLTAMSQQWYTKKWVAAGLHILFWALFFVSPFLLRPFMSSNNNIEKPHIDFYSFFTCTCSTTHCASCFFTAMPMC